MGPSIVRKVGSGQTTKRQPNNAIAHKKHAKSKDQVQNSAMDLFNDVEKSDLAFLMRGFGSNPELVPWLASLMRDGVLEKTLHAKLVGGQHIELGKKLPEKSKRLRNLPPRFFNVLWLNLWKDAPSLARADKMSMEDHVGLAQWSLRLTADSEIPIEHKSSEYEGPLLAVFKARHCEVGSRLQDFTTEKFKMQAYGYFKLPNPFVGTVSVGSQHMVKVIAPERAAEASDWEIHECYNFDAALISVSLQYSQGLLCIARSNLSTEDYENVFVNHDSKFELPNAADMFPSPKVYETPKKEPVPIAAVAAPSAAGASAMTVGGVIVTPMRQRRLLTDAAMS
jgi:hypothetical protein